MPAYLVLIALFISSGFLHGQNARESPDEFLTDFIVGKYKLVGSLPDSPITYSGSVIIEKGQKGMRVWRILKDRKIEATGFIEQATADKIKVFRVRFTENGLKYEITYLIHSDLDNYARLSGYLYPLNKKTKQPGLETLFHLPETLH